MNDANAGASGVAAEPVNVSAIHYFRRNGLLRSASANRSNAPAYARRDRSGAWGRSTSPERAGVRLAEADARLDSVGRGAPAHERAAGRRAERRPPDVEALVRRASRRRVAGFARATACGCDRPSKACALSRGRAAGSAGWIEGASSSGSARPRSTSRAAGRPDRARSGGPARRLASTTPEEQADRLAEKVAALRVFDGADGPSQRAARRARGAAASASSPSTATPARGNRPSYTRGGAG